jgi:two-component sensor histidine kinase
VRDLLAQDRPAQIWWVALSARSRHPSRAQLGRELACARRRIEELERALGAREPEVRPLLQKAGAASSRLEALEAELRQVSRQKDLLLREMNHRVGNNLAVLLGLLDRERAVTQGPAGASGPNKLSRFILGLAVVHRMLSETGWRPVPLAALSRAILESVLSGSQPAARVRVADSSVSVSSRVADRIALVLSELALNSLKHCGNRQLIEIEVRIRTNQQRVVFEYRDNGPGYPTGLVRLTGSTGGLGLISELASHGLDGTLALSNNSGATATFTFSASDDLYTLGGASHCERPPPLTSARTSPP